MVRTLPLLMLVCAPVLPVHAVAASPSAQAAPAAAPAATVEWMTDFEAAKARAAQEGKAVLMDFTGSDWCAWCIKLRKDVFDKPAFAEYAKDKFVLMEVDLPNRDIDPDLKARNEALCEWYSVDGFPTVLVVTPEGEVVGGFGGGGRDMKAVQACLDTALSNISKLKAARAASGLERAKLFMEVYNAFPEELRPLAGGIAAEIKANDPDDICGLGRVEKAAAELDAFQAELDAVGGDWRKRLELLKSQAERCMPENKPIVLMFQGRIMAYGAETVEDVQAAKAVMLQAAELTPDKSEADVMRAYAEGNFGDPEAALKRIRAARNRGKVGN